MHSHLYPRLACSNLRKHARLYIPYLLASAVAVMMFYIMMALQHDPGIYETSFARDTRLILVLGCVVIGVFSLLLLFYTSSLLTKQRKHEFGLYNVLGMEKRHIARLLLWETLLTALLSVAAGILCGLLFSKLMQLLLLRLMGLAANFSFGIDLTALLATVLLFGAIFLLVTLNTLQIVYRAKPVELLRSASEGEREPKSRWLLAVLGLLSLGCGYALALRVDDMLDAINWFFLAVLLVILGTYLCFTAFSIVLLKALRKNKRYYYKINHFASVSGMLYRMKRNAAGLASICILSTMVLVTVSTTFSLYLGIDAINRSSTPYDLRGTTWGEGIDSARLQEETARFEEICAKQAVEMTDYASFPRLGFAVLREGDSLLVEAHGDGWSPAVYSGAPDPRAVTLRLITADGYNQITGKAVTLAPDEVLVWSKDTPFGSSVTLLNQSYRAAPFSDTLPSLTTDIEDMPSCVLVVDSLTTLRSIEQEQRRIYFNFINTISFETHFNLSGEEDAKARCAQLLVREDQRYDYVMNLQNGIEARQSTYRIYGAFFFIGIFLGLLFALATVLIIYYKQISEGYDDRARYDIMQKVGMTQGEIRRTVHAQIITVFFLPLLTAAVHIAFAFPMICKIMTAFRMTDIRLFAICTLATLGVFALLYLAVYLLTARAYYRIVSHASEVRPL